VWRLAAVAFRHRAAELWRCGWAQAAAWRHRARSRRELTALDDRRLRDLNFTRDDALLEARKPFWVK
jgi:uncharacterized protein YjiS (DUF1127 family)